MRVYFDTGAFIDYLSTRGSANALLRSAERRGRAPADIAADAERLFEKVSKTHTGATSCLTYYEVEEALYRLLTQAATGISRAGSAASSTRAKQLGRALRSIEFPGDTIEPMSDFKPRPGSFLPFLEASQREKKPSAPSTPSTWRSRFTLLGL